MAEEKSSGNHLSKADQAKIDGIIFSYHLGNNMSEREVLEKWRTPNRLHPAQFLRKPQVVFSRPVDRFSLPLSSVIPNQQRLRRLRIKQK